MKTVITRRMVCRSDDATSDGSPPGRHHADEGGFLRIDHTDEDKSQGAPDEYQAEKDQLTYRTIPQRAVMLRQ